MPLIREISPAGGIHAGIWQITETADELLDLTRLTNPELNTYRSFRHELRKKQWLAYRTLLKQLLAPLNSAISYDQFGKPGLLSGSHHISVSHAGELAAVVYSEQYVVGIDIEKMRDRAERVKERFLQAGELESLSGESHHLEKLYVFWGGKEAIFKLHGKPDADLRNDIYIHPFDYLCNRNRYCRAALTIGNQRMDYTLFFEPVEGYMLVVAY